jgi:hypothetical protein
VDEAVRSTRIENATNMSNGVPVSVCVPVSINVTTEPLFSGDTKGAAWLNCFRLRLPANTGGL